MEITPGALPDPITQDVTSPRQTAADGGERFRAALRVGARSLVAGAASAAAGVPGAPLLSAAVRGPAASTSQFGTPESPGAVETVGTEPASDVSTILERSQAFNMYYLQLQEQMSTENRRFSALSNVMKARHETSKTAIGNIR